MPRNFLAAPTRALADVRAVTLMLLAMVATAACGPSEAPVTGPGPTVPAKLLQDSLEALYPEPVAARLRELDSLQLSTDAGTLRFGALRVDGTSSQTLFTNFGTSVSVSVFGANQAGVAVGFRVASTYPGGPFITTPTAWLPGGGAITMNAVSGASNATWAYGINAGGQVAGCATMSGTSVPVFWNSVYHVPVVLSRSGLPAGHACAWEVADDGEILGVFVGSAGERGLVRWSGSSGAPRLTLLAASLGPYFSLIGGLPDEAGLVRVGNPGVYGILDANGIFTSLDVAAGTTTPLGVSFFFPQGPAADGTIPLGINSPTGVLPAKLVRTGQPWGPGSYQVEYLSLGTSGFTGGRPYIAWSATRLAGAAGTAGVGGSGRIVVWDEEDVTPIAPSTEDAWLWAGPEALILRNPMSGSIGYRRVSLTFETPDPGETPTGSDVAVTPEDQDGATPVSLSFETVTGGGTSSVTSSSTGAPPPVGFKLGSPPRYYEISTTATFSGPVEVCITYVPQEFTRPDLLRLFHDAGGGWADITTSNDATAGRICGETASLSPFVLAESALEFAGFFAPIDNLPSANVAKAGQGVPVKFGLGGDFGLTVLASGYPKVQLISCATAASQDAVEETVTAGSSALRYDPDSGQYIYVWKTDPAWSGTCRRLTLRFIDGQEQNAMFRFTK